MNTAATERAARVAARNEIETAKARVPQPIQQVFLWNAAAEPDSQPEGGAQ